MSFGARAQIRLGALRHNFKTLTRAVPGAKAMAVIKGNAFGHGLLPVAHALDEADSFAVARFSEALELREAGIDKPVVLLEGCLSRDELAVAADQGFEPVVHSEIQVEMLAGFDSGALTVWLKFDTGMNRLGLPTQDAGTRIAELSDMASVRELRLITHLANADEPDDPATERQLSRFESVAAGFNGAVSIANSAAILGVPDIRRAVDRFGFHGDHWIRPGVALFGISPLAGRSAADVGLRPVMHLEGRLIAVKPLAKGDSVGYRGRYVSRSDTTLGIIAIGYGDGYSRHFRDGTPVLLNGRRVPLVGIVSMDMIAVDLGAEATDSIGDLATLWGEGLPIEEVAPWADTIPYDLVTGVVHREKCEILD